MRMGVTEGRHHHSTFGINEGEVVVPIDYFGKVRLFPERGDLAVLYEKVGVTDFFDTAHLLSLKTGFAFGEDSDEGRYVPYESLHSVTVFRRGPPSRGRLWIS